MTSSPSLPPLKIANRRLNRWKKSPRTFVLEAFATDTHPAPTLEPWQAEALDLIGAHDRVSIRAGHGVGKTALIAWVVLWFMATRSPFKIPITANSQDQLRDVVWPEIRKWRDRLDPGLAAQISIMADRIVRHSASDSSFAVARTASPDNPEALQGFHEDNLLFVIEEASGIADIVFEVAQGALSTPGAKVLCTSAARRAAASAAGSETTFFFGAGALWGAGASPPD